MEPFKEQKDMEDKDTSFRGVLTEFMGYTSGHGFGRLVAATSFIWRIFWILAVFCAFGMFVIEVMDLFKLYLSRPVQTSVSVTFEKQLKFPAVTICNLNIIKRSSMMYLPDDLVGSFPLNHTYYTPYVEKKKNATTNTKKMPKVVNTSENPIGSAKIDTGQATTGLDVAAKPTTGQGTAKNIQGTKDAVYTTEKPNEVLKSTVNQTKALNITGKPTEEFSTTGKPTADLKGTTPKPKRRRKREESKEEDKDTDAGLDSKGYYGSTKTPGSDDKVDSKKEDGKYDGGVYDKKNDENYDDGKKNDDYDGKKNDDYDGKKNDDYDGKKNDDYYDNGKKNDDYYSDWADYGYLPRSQGHLEALRSAHATD